MSKDPKHPTTTAVDVNGRSRDQQSLSAPTLLMAMRRGRPEHSGDAEPVLVAQTTSEVILVLDTGEELRFDQSELRKALDR